MNFIALSNQYWRLHSEEAFEPSDSHLYWCLLNEFNRRGDKAKWPDSLTFIDGSLAMLTGTNVKTMVGARERLKTRQLIDVTSLGPGNKKGSVYRLTSPSTSPRTYPKNGEVDGEVEGEVSGEDNGEVAPTSPKNGEVNAPKVGSPLPEPLRQPLPEPLQNSESSHIYNEYQTPDAKRQTSQAEPKKNADTTVDAEVISLVGTEKPSTPQVAAAPPSPIPMYGDGRLHRQVSEFHRNFPDDFPLEMLIGFLRHFTQIVQDGEKYPGKVGWELHAAQDSWTIRTRLEKWNIGYLRDQQKLNNSNGSATRQNNANGHGAAVGRPGSAKAGNSRPVRRTTIITADRLSRESPPNGNTSERGDERTIVIDVE